MIYTGLVSVTFRKLSPEEIIQLTAKAGLDGIEWGGDIHVPHGDTRRAREVLKMTKDAGLKVASYGSYYRIGAKENQVPFGDVLETAAALEAPTIRVWAGIRGSDEADEEYWNTVIEESRRLSDIASTAGITVSYEYHNETLTDTPEAADRLLRSVNHTNIRTYWQPPLNLEKAMRLSSLQQITPWLSNLHVFYAENGKKLPLANGKQEWMRYFAYANTLKEGRYAMLEFVKGDSPEQFLDDAAALKEMIISLR